MQRLDRAMCNMKWINLFPKTVVRHLGRTCSHHSPLSIEINKNTTQKGGMFRFLGVWTKHHSFLEVVKNFWEDPIIGRPMHVFAKKLSRLRYVLQLRNINIFGKVDQNVKKDEDDIIACELALELGAYNEKRAQLKLAEANYYSN